VIGTTASMKKPKFRITHPTPTILPAAALATVRGGSGRPIIRNGDEPAPPTSSSA